MSNEDTRPNDDRQEPRADPAPPRDRDEIVTTYEDIRRDTQTPADVHQSSGELAAVSRVAYRVR
jgi:hypothetical protein